MSDLLKYVIVLVIVFIGTFFIIKCNGTYREEVVEPEVITIYVTPEFYRPETIIVYVTPEPTMKPVITPKPTFRQVGSKEYKAYLAKLKKEIIKDGDAVSVEFIDIEFLNKHKDKLRLEDSSSNYFYLSIGGETYCIWNEGYGFEIQTFSYRYFIVKPLQFEQFRNYVTDRFKEIREYNRIKKDDIDSKMNKLLENM
jgi:hypothetical protein